MQVGTDDTQFWTPTLSDVWYKCNATPTAGSVNSKCTNTGNDYLTDTVNVESADKNDWVLPYTDDDTNNPWCTRANGTGVTYSPFQCKVLKCIMERPILTKESTVTPAVFDLQLTTVNSAAGDQIIIRRGRAKLYINKDVNPKPYLLVLPTVNNVVSSGTAATTTGLSIPIIGGASALNCSAIVALILAYNLF